MLIADSHEFVELYRGDRDLRMGIEMTRAGDGVQVVVFAPDRLSPNDRERFGHRFVREVGLPEFPPGMEARLLPSVSVRFRRKESGGVLSLMPGYGPALMALRPDVVLENPYSWLTPRSYQTWRAARRLGIPYVYHDPGDDIPVGALHRVMATWERPVVRGAAAIITYNEAGRRRFAAKYGAESIVRVIPKPVDVARMRAPGERERVRAGLGIADDQVAVGYLGRLAEYKGSAYLRDVAAVSRVPGSDLARCVFVFIGGRLGSNEAAAGYDLPNTRVTGMIDNAEVPAYLAACDIVAFPDLTRPGGFSTAIAETMAAARPIVVGLGESDGYVPLTDGQTATIVPPRDVGALATAIGRLASDPAARERLAGAAGAFAESRMDYPVVAREYLAILRDAVAGHRADRGARR